MGTPLDEGEHFLMNPEERRALLMGVGILVLVSLARFGWDSRPMPPLLPLDTSAYESLIPQVEAAVAEESRRRTPLAPGERLDPNRADAVGLSRLPGVGPSLANRLVEAREARGWFMRVDDLLEVPGVGPTTLERLRPYLEITPPPAEVRLTQPELGGAWATAARVSLNRATADELEMLPGIGPALAGRIVEDRIRHGPDQTLADLTRVSGVGPALVSRLEGRVEVP